MKAEEASSREERGREKRIHSATVAFVAVNILISVFLFNSILNRSLIDYTDVNLNSSPKAAIVDQVSLTYPNQIFIQEATDILEQAGYSVDYYPSEEITVRFFKNISMFGYKLIILRVHSSLTNPYTAEGPVNIFTSEYYSNAKYIDLQLTDQLVMVGFSQDDIKKGNAYFGINPNFITRSMGRFKNTTIIMMGCDGLNDTKMAKAFVENGARVYIGWNVSVAGDETDTATVHILRHSLIEKTTLEESIRRALKDLDIHSNKLSYYPLDAGKQTIENNG